MPLDLKKKKGRVERRTKAGEWWCTPLIPAFRGTAKAAAQRNPRLKTKTKGAGVVL